MYTLIKKEDVKIIMTEEVNEYGVYSDIYDDVDEAAKIMTRVMCRAGNLGKELQKYDRQVSDILHEIELDNLDAVGLMHWVLELRKVLRARRTLKETLIMIQELNGSSITSRLTKTVARAQNRPERRAYRYREIEVPIAVGKKVA